ncbi:caspase 8 [Pelomyxa schiedti]|nr:caspase 8 [Pelomyxa schiedti]
MSQPNSSRGTQVGGVITTDGATDYSGKNLSSCDKGASGAGVDYAVGEGLPQTGGTPGQPASTFYPYNMSGFRGAALVIANSEYVRLPNLNGCVHDGALAAATWSKLGYQVELKQNLTAEGIKCAIAELCNRAVKEWDSVVVHYSGHGTRVPITYEGCTHGKSNDVDDAVIGVDGDANAGVSVKEILDRFMPKVAPLLAARPKIFVFDCCRGAAAEKACPRGGTVVDNHLASVVATLPDYADMVIGNASRPYHLAFETKGAGIYSGTLYGCMDQNMSSTQSSQEKNLVHQSPNFCSYLRKDVYVGSREVHAESARGSVPIETTTSTSIEVGASKPRENKRPVPQHSVFVFSDLHLGAFPPVRDPAKWEQRDLPDQNVALLQAQLNKWNSEICGLSLSVERTVVMNGDIFDFWAQPLDVLFTTISDITSEETMAVIPEWGQHLTLACHLFKDTVLQLHVCFFFFYFGIFFTLAFLKHNLAQKTGVKFIYVKGNHDMTVTEVQLQEFFGEVPIVVKEDCHLLHLQNKKYIRFEHGHAKDAFNAPVKDKHLRCLDILPIGYLITRLHATNFEQTSSVRDIVQEEILRLVKSGLPTSLGDILRTIIKCTVEAVSGKKIAQLAEEQIKTPQGIMTVGRALPLLEYAMVSQVESMLGPELEPRCAEITKKAKHKFMEFLLSAHPLLPLLAACFFDENYGHSLLQNDAEIEAIVFGHTHECYSDSLKHQQYFNDGACCKGVSAIQLDIRESKVHGSFRED